jgi:beta-galactosidase
MPIWYGGDYNPEQWPEAIWAEDLQLMQRAGVNLATVGVFSWARLEPREGEFDFGWLDRVLDGLHAGGVRVDLATATASPPPWLTHRYPEVLPVTEDGIRLSPGSRQHYCPSSPVYRRLAGRLVEALAERYASHPALELWHINNEYGCHVSRCYCDVSAQAFRSWLQRRYSTIEGLNEAWGTAFWSQQYSEFAEVYPPRAAPTFKNPTQQLDFRRFSSDELLECYRMEKSILRRITPGVPVTTNFMGFFENVDYWTWSSEVDVISDDSYPDPADPDSPAYAAMVRDLVRSLGGGRPWILMEQAASAVNWRRRNAAKPAGMNRAYTHQCVSRGADGIMYFQWRQSVAGAEKFHSGMVPHSGTDTKTWREIEQLGTELGDLGAVVGARVPADVAIMFDWDSWWSIEQDATPGDIRYVEHAFAWYRELYRRTVSADFVRPGDDLSRYRAVIVPSLFMASEAARESLDEYTRQGGRLLVTFQTAILDPDGHITSGGYLGGLAETLGLRVEEFAPPAGPDLERNGQADVPTLHIGGSLLPSSAASLWGEYIHADSAEVIASFAGDELDGWPAITRNSRGAGKAWYAATLPAADGMAALLDDVLTDAGVRSVLAEPVPSVEAVQRGSWTFLINHSVREVPVEIEGTTHILQPYGVAVIAHQTGVDDQVSDTALTGRR